MNSGQYHYNGTRNILVVAFVVVATYAIIVSCFVDHSNSRHNYSNNSNEYSHSSNYWKSVSAMALTSQYHSIAHARRGCHHYQNAFHSCFRPLPSSPKSNIVSRSTGSSSVLWNSMHRDETSSTLLSRPSWIHRLYLVRHGDSIWNGGQKGYTERFTGWTDVPLSPKGYEEAKHAGTLISSLLYHHSIGYGHKPIDICFTSILQRAKETTYEMAQSIQNDIIQQNQKYKQNMQASKLLFPINCDYRLNERHYGSLQGLSKRDVELGLYNHNPEEVRLWRRSWHTLPPLLDDDDPRRKAEIQQYIAQCANNIHNIPKGESLARVAKTRIKPFLYDTLTPILNELANLKYQQKQQQQQQQQQPEYNNHESITNSESYGSSALIVGHANSLRALIGVLCDVEDDPMALSLLEELRIPTCVPLVIQYKEHDRETISSGSTIYRKLQVCDLPNAEECLIMYGDDDDILENRAQSSTASTNIGDYGHPKLPIWPLDQCILHGELLLSSNQPSNDDSRVRLDKYVRSY